MISTSPDAIRARAEAWAAVVGGEVIASESTVGGGSLPGETLPTWALCTSRGPAQRRGGAAASAPPAGHRARGAGPPAARSAHRPAGTGRGPAGCTERGVSMHVIGTAGHVDHGKSTLTHALTGINPDRLAEEQIREMTIDLGFAWLDLPTGERVGHRGRAGPPRFHREHAGRGGRHRRRAAGHRRRRGRDAPDARAPRHPRPAGRSPPA